MITFQDEPQQGTINLDESSDNQESVNPAAVNWNAERTDYAMGDASPGKDAIASYYTLGQQGALRQQMSFQASMNLEKKKISLISQMAKSAAMEGRSLNGSEQNYIQGLSQADTNVDPQTVIEKAYAQNVTQDVAAQNPSTQNVDLDTSPAKPTIDLYQRFLANQEIAKTTLANAQSKYDQEGLPNKVLDFAAGFIPIVSEAAMTSDENGNVNPMGIINEGGELSKQYNKLLLLPPDQFKVAVDKKVSDLQNNFSNQAAAQWVSGLLHYSATDAANDTVSSVMDVGTLAAGPAAKIAKGLAGVAKVNGVSTLDKVGRMATVGNVEGAVEANASDQINNALTGASSTTPVPGQRISQQSINLSKQAPQWLNPAAPLVDPGSMTAEGATRLRQALTSNQATLMTLLDQESTVKRVNTATMKALFDNYRQNVFPQRFNHLNGSVVDQRFNPNDEVFGGVPSVTTVLGKTDATSFKNAAQAQFFAKRMYHFPDGAYTIQQEGNNWYLHMTQSLDETGPVARANRISTDNVQPENMQDAAINMASNPDYFLSQLEVENRKIATYGQSGSMSAIKSVLTKFGALSKQSRQELGMIMDEAKRMTRPVIQPNGTTQMVTGKYYQTVADLDQAFQTRFGRMPTQKEAEAYFTMKDVMDAQWESINRRVKRDKERQAIEEHQFAFVPPKVGKPQYSKWFEGADRPALPVGKDFTVGWIDDSGKPQHALFSRLSAKRKTALVDLANRPDSQITKTFDPRDPVLNNIFNSGGAETDYVVSRTRKSRPLSDVQVPYNEGGHQEYPIRGTWMKQPQVHWDKYGRLNYDGDKTAYHFNIDKEARDIHRNTEQLRQKILDGASDQELDNWLPGKLPFADAAEARKQFYDRLTKTGNPDAPFDLRTPFVLLKNGQSSRDAMNMREVFGDKFYDSSENVDDLRNKVSTVFTQSRDDPALTVFNRGSHSNPIYSIRPARFLDPYLTIKNTAKDLIRNRWYEDYVHQSAEDGALQFGHLLKKGEEAAFANPVLNFLNAGKTDWVANASKTELSQAMRTQRAIRNLLAYPTQDVTWADWFQNKIVNGIYSARGQEWTENFLKPWQWDDRTDPSRILRGLVFHTYLGLFNPLQILRQGISVVNAMAIDGNPRRSSQAALAYLYMRWRGIVPDKHTPVLTKILANALGLRDDVLDDMYRAWHRSGMHAQEGEVSQWNDISGPKIFEGKIGKALDAGQFFFREGNNINRGVAFALSYLEWAEKHEFFDGLNTARVDNNVLHRMVSRADIMYQNMSRASNASLQQGITSIPAQFTGYYWRLNEQMLRGTLGGKGVLTTAEKRRLLLVNSMLFGFPAAAGSVVGFWPASESLRQAALEQGITDDNPITTAVMDGVPALIVKMLSGDRLDIGGAYGPGGMSTLKDLLVDHNLTEAMGAGPNFVGSLLDKSAPFFRAAMSVFQPGSDKYELHQSDYVSALQLLPVVNDAVKAWGIYNSGKYKSQASGATIETFDKGDWTRTMAAALGITPQEVTDTYLKMNSTETRKNVMKQFEEGALKQFRLGMEAGAAGDQKGQLSYFNNAHALMDEGGFTPFQASQVFLNALKGNTDLYDSASNKFTMQDPEQRMQPYSEGY